MRFGLQAKLMAAFAGVAALVALGGLLLALGLGSVERSYEQVNSTIVPADMLATEIQLQVYRQTAAVRGYLLTQNRAHLDDYSHAGAERKALEAKMLTLVPDSAVRTQVDRLETLGQQWDKTIQQVFMLAQEGKIAEAQALSNRDAAPITPQLLEIAGQISNEMHKRAKAGTEEARNAATEARVGGQVASGLGLLAALVLASYLARSLARPIILVSRLAGELAAGNLAVERLPEGRSDEVGDLARSVNGMVAALQKLIGQVDGSTRAVAEAANLLGAVSDQASLAAGQTAQAVVQVSAGTTRQADSATEVDRTVMQLQEVIQQVAASAEQTASDVQKASEALAQMVAEVDAVAQSAAENSAAAQQAAGVAGGGVQVVSEAVAGMGRIKAAVGESAERVRSLALQTQQIGAINATISGIADQTNLLALNAAIEAARAGEHGRGFAVVADEVRKLAERSSQSAREISALIEGIQRGTAETVTAMEKGTLEVDQGVRLADNTGRALEEIRTAAQHTAGEIASISRATASMKVRAASLVQLFDAMAAVSEENTAATEEMAASAVQVTEAIRSIAAVSQENAAIAEEVSASAEEVTASAGEVATAASDLVTIAQDLKAQVSQFRL